MDIQVGDCVQREMSILFSDIRSFTTISEQMPPKEIFQFLNEYLKVMEPPIRSHSGFIDKFIGDAVMALFDKQVDDALHAALSMQQALDEFNRHQKRLGNVPQRHKILLINHHRSIWNAVNNSLKEKENGRKSSNWSINDFTTTERETLR